MINNLKQMNQLHVKKNWVNHQRFTHINNITTEQQLLFEIHFLSNHTINYCLYNLTKRTSNQIQYFFYSQIFISVTHKPLIYQSNILPILTEIF